MLPNVIGSILAAALMMAAGTPAASEPAPPLSGERMQAAYWNELATSLAGSEDAHDLLTAALVTTLPGKETTQAASRVADLLARAERAAPADPLVWWVAASRCEPAGAGCDEAQAAARTHLLRVDPDNAVHWLLQMAQAWKAGARTEAYAALANAAAASRADDHLVALALMIAKRIEAHPPSPALLHSNDKDAQVREFAMAGGMAVTTATTIPQWKPLLDACNAPAESASAQHCLAVARLLQDSNSMLGARIGYALEQRMDGAARPVVTERRRQLDWMITQYARLGEDGDTTTSWLASLQQSGNEQHALRTVLLANGIPLQPPADWTGPRAD